VGHHGTEEAVHYCVVPQRTHWHSSGRLYDGSYLMITSFKVSIHFKMRTNFKLSIQFKFSIRAVSNSIKRTHSQIHSQYSLTHSLSERTQGGHSSRSSNSAQRGCDRRWHSASSSGAHRVRLVRGPCSP